MRPASLRASYRVNHSRLSPRSRPSASRISIQPAASGTRSSASSTGKWYYKLSGRRCRTCMTTSARGLISAITCYRQAYLPMQSLIISIGSSMIGSCNITLKGIRIDKCSEDGVSKKEIHRRVRAQLAKTTATNS